MKSSGYIFAILLLLNYHCINAQYNIEYTNIARDDNFVFTRIIDSKTYHFSHKSIGNIEYGSELIAIDDGIATDISWIYQINDTMFCHKLIDMWKYNDKLQLLAYTFANENNFISLLEFDLNSATVELKSNHQINEYRYIYHYNFKDLIIEGYRNILILEHIKDNNKINAILLFKIVGETLDISKFTYTQPVNSYLLYDHFYNNEDNEFYISNGKEYVSFDKNFNFVSQQRAIIYRDGVKYSINENLILGNNNNKLITYERHSPSNSNLILSRREITIADTFQFDNNYTDFNPDEDCYLVRKIFKDSCNYMYYSRSTINGQNSDYGFNIISFNKQGDLLSNQVFKSDRPMAVYDIDIDEKAKKLSGIGAYFDDFTQFSFTADLKKTIVNTTENDLNKISLLHNKIGHQVLYVNPTYYETKVQLYNISGQLINCWEIDQDIDISDLIQGYYFIQYQFEDQILTERFVKM